nr:unnamed protein product [Spirometra erinaceieuropaei]
MKNNPVASVSLLLTHCCPPMLYTSCFPPSLRAASLHFSLPTPHSPLPIHQPVPWRLQEVQDAWTACKTEEIQWYSYHNEWNNSCLAIKAVYGPTAKGTAPLLSADVTILLTGKTRILQQWVEYFRRVLNRPFTISDANIACRPQVETNADLDLPPSFHETIRTVQLLSSGKASRQDSITAEIYKRSGPKSWVI